jgi:hypothetical protein
MATEDDDFTNDPRFADAVAKAVAKHAEEQQREADAKKPPKDFGDGAKRIADAVWDAFDERSKQREKEAAAEDEEPSRGGTSSGILGFLSGDH